MGDENEGDPRALLDLFQLVLHIFAQFQIEGAQRFVKQKHFGMIDQRPGDGHTLLLTAGETGHTALCEAREHHEREHFVDFFFDLLFG